jgi:hypothetical protein
VTNHKWSRQTLDLFVLARLEKLGWTPSREAQKHVLARRLTFDLTGLPPTPAEVEAFLNDDRPDAYERLIDRLLASEGFGERMASMWLPLARYAEDQAHIVDGDTSMCYPNAWRYRKWVTDAFNHNLPYDRFLKLQLAVDQLEGTNSSNLAALGFLGLGPKYYDRQRLHVKADEWEDRVDTVSRAMLGLTVACARCHDHKFDPITTRDYYAIAGVFASTRMINRRPDGTRERGKVQSTNMSPATLHVLEDAADPQDLPVFIGGSVDNKGPLVPRRFLRVLSATEPEPFLEGSGRSELADCIASPDNPLTARVIVNRIWGHVFGNPLVRTPSNFGHTGKFPTHPQLLDHLAVRFTQEGWSIKRLIRSMVLSATYRQTSTLPTVPAIHDLDPANQWLSHMNRRRLTIEQWRDAVLFITGELAAADDKSSNLDDPDNLKRTLYSQVSRNALSHLLMQFDYPDANVHAEDRVVTTSALQKLFVLNSTFMSHRAKALATRLQTQSTPNSEAAVHRAYQLIFNRPPQPEEIELALEFLGKPATGETSRWEQYAHLLLASNELLYLD